MPIGFLIKGQRRDIIILGETLKEAEKEMKKHKKDIEKFIGEKISKSAKKRVNKISITTLILELKAEKFFDKPRTSQDIRKALASKGHHYAATSLTWSLQSLVRKKELGRIPEGKGWKYVKR